MVFSEFTNAQVLQQATVLFEDLPWWQLGVISDVGGGVAPSQCEMLAVMLQSLLLVVFAVVDSVAESQDRDALDAITAASRVWPATGPEVFFFGFTQVGLLLFGGILNSSVVN